MTFNDYARIALAAVVGSAYVATSWVFIAALGSVL